MTKLISAQEHFLIGCSRRNVLNDASPQPDRNRKTDGKFFYTAIRSESVLTPQVSNERSVAAQTYTNRRNDGFSEVDFYALSNTGGSFDVYNDDVC